MTSTRCLALALTLLASGLVALAQVPMREGRWEISMQMQMPDMPVAMPPVKMTQCVTADDLKDPRQVVPRGSPEDASKCEVSNYKVVGNKVTWKVVCKGPESITGDGEMTSSGDAYEGRMKMSVGDEVFTMKINGKRVGDCAK